MIRDRVRDIDYMHLSPLPLLRGHANVNLADLIILSLR